PRADRKTNESRRPTFAFLVQQPAQQLILVTSGVAPIVIARHRFRRRREGRFGPPSMEPSVPVHSRRGTRRPAPHPSLPTPPASVGSRATLHRCTGSLVCGSR